LTKIPDNRGKRGHTGKKLGKTRELKWVLTKGPEAGGTLRRAVFPVPFSLVAITAATHGPEASGLCCCIQRSGAACSSATS
jgi:hypothetical protein